MMIYIYIYDVMICNARKPWRRVWFSRLEIQQEILVLPEQRRGLCGARAVLGPGKRHASPLKDLPKKSWCFSQQKCGFNMILPSGK